MGLYKKCENCSSSKSAIELYKDEKCKECPNYEQFKKINDIKPRSNHLSRFDEAIHYSLGSEFNGKDNGFDLE